MGDAGWGFEHFVAELVKFAGEQRAVDFHTGGDDVVVKSDSARGEDNIAVFVEVAPIALVVA